MPSQIIRAEDDIEAFFDIIRATPRPLTFSWVRGADRTEEQNALQWMWAAEAAMQRGDCDAVDQQAEWKLTKGVPILRSDCAKFRGVYDAVIRPKSYEEKIALMKMGFPVSQQMKVRQMVRYMDAISQSCVEQGIVLTDPKPDLARYQARNRQKVTA